MASTDEEKSKWPVLSEEVLKNLVVQCMEKVGAKQEPAQLLAEILIMADKRGHYSHGINRLDIYVRDTEKGVTYPNAEPEILKQTAATAWVDGHDSLGVVVGRFCMDLAIKKAKEVGIGWVVAKRSTHFGIAGYYSMMAANSGLVGMAYTNCSPAAVPTRARTPAIGTNPISVIANGANADSFELDMATSTVAIGKIEIAQRRGQSIPNGWGCDGEGKQTNNAEECLANGGCLPLGGTEETGGYKGFGLAMMVELFCGVLAGAGVGPNIRKWTSTEMVADLGQCFVALNPECFAPGFEGRVSEFMASMKSLDLAEGETEILVPGDPEKSHIAMCDVRGGIPYHPNQLQFLVDFAKKYDVPSPSVLK